MRNVSLDERSMADGVRLGRRFRRIGFVLYRNKNFNEAISSKRGKGIKKTNLLCPCGKAGFTFKKNKGTIVFIY